MAPKHAPIVEVLKFNEEEAYNHDRPISSLIRTQLLHLHHAENIVVPPKARTNININHLLTERQASEYIQRVTELLHRFGKRTGTKSKTKKPAKPRASTPTTKAGTKRTKTPNRSGTRRRLRQ